MTDGKKYILVERLTVSPFVGPYRVVRDTPKNRKKYKGKIVGKCDKKGNLI